MTLRNIICIYIYIYTYDMIMIIVICLYIYIYMIGGQRVAYLLVLGRGDDAVGNPRRAQVSQFQLFELILLLRSAKQFPVEQIEAIVSQSAAPTPPLRFLNHVASVTRRHRFRLDFRPPEHYYHYYYYYYCYRYYYYHYYDCYYYYYYCYYYYHYYY